jgi:hypothetical protein
MIIEKCSLELLNKDSLKKILLLRNQKEVREASFNTNIIQEKEHIEWYNKKIKKPFFNHYVLTHNKKIIGLGYGDKFSKKNKSCLWGFYTDLSIKSEIKYGSINKYLLIEKLFENKNIFQIECQVKKGFEWIRDWHIKWGHQQIDFDNKLNCYNLVLKEKIWSNIKTKIYEKGFKRS